MSRLPCYVLVLVLFSKFVDYRRKYPSWPKSKKISFVAGLQKSLHTKKKHEIFEGTKETPITIDATIDADEKRLKMENSSVSLTDENAGQKRKRQNSTTEGGKRKKIIDEVRLLTFSFSYLV